MAPSNRQRADISGPGRSIPSAGGPGVATPRLQAPTASTTPQVTAKYGSVNPFPENMQAPAPNFGAARALGAAAGVAASVADYRNFLVQREIRTNYDIAQRDAKVRAEKAYNEALVAQSQKFQEGYVLKDGETPLGDFVKATVGSDEFWQSSPGFQALPDSYKNELRSRVLSDYQVRAMGDDTDTRIEQGYLRHERNVEESRREVFARKAIIVPSEDGPRLAGSPAGESIGIQETLALKLGNSMLQPTAKAAFIRDMYYESVQAFVLDSGDPSPSTLAILEKEFEAENGSLVDPSDRARARALIDAAQRARKPQEFSDLKVASAEANRNAGAPHPAEALTPETQSRAESAIRLLQALKDSDPKAWSEADEVRLRGYQAKADAAALVFDYLRNEVAVNTKAIEQYGKRPTDAVTMAEGLQHMLHESQGIENDTTRDPKERETARNVRQMLEKTLYEADDADLVKSFVIGNATFQDMSYSEQGEYFSKMYALGLVPKIPKDQVEFVMREFLAVNPHTLAGKDLEAYNYRALAIMESGTDSQKLAAFAGVELDLDNAAPFNGATAIASGSDELGGSRFFGAKADATDLFKKVQGLAFQQLLGGDREFADNYAKLPGLDRDKKPDMESKLKNQLKARTLDLMNSVEVRVPNQAPRIFSKEAVMGYDNPEYRSALVAIAGKLAPRAMVPAEIHERYTAMQSGASVLAQGRMSRASSLGGGLGVEDSSANAALVSDLRSSIQGASWAPGQEVIRDTLLSRLAGVSNPRTAASLFEGFMQDLQFNARAVADASGSLVLQSKVGYETVVTPPMTFNALESYGDQAFANNIKGVMSTGIVGWARDGDTETILQDWEPWTPPPVRMQDLAMTLSELPDTIDWKTQGARVKGTFDRWESLDGKQTVIRMQGELGSSPRTPRLMEEQSSAEGLDSMHLISRSLAPFFKDTAQQITDSKENLLPGSAFINRVMQEKGFESSARKRLEEYVSQNPWAGQNLEVTVATHSEDAVTYEKDGGFLSLDFTGMKPRVQALHVRIAISYPDGTPVQDFEPLEAFITDPSALSIYNRVRK